MQISVSVRSDEGIAAAATAAAVCAGQMLGTALGGATIDARAVAAVFTSVFVVGLVSGRRERDAGLRLACDAISAIGTGATFYAVPGLLVF